MKTPVSPHMVALFFLGSLAPLTAQNLASAPRPLETSSIVEISDEGRNSNFAEDSALLGNYEVPAVEKAQGQISDGKPVYAAQDALTLNTETSSPRNVESVVDLNVLRHPSPFRRIAVSSHGGASSEISTDNLQSNLALISAVYRESGKSEKGADCLKVALSVEQRIKLDPAKVLEVVEFEVGANPSCACEIVKMAINTSEADVQLVVSIVETAITVSPESMRMVSQCAIATMPESITAVQALLAKLDPNSGDESASSKDSKSAKSAKVAAIVSSPPPDPLDRPYLPPSPPPPHFPPPVTDVNPCTY